MRYLFFTIDPASSYLIIDLIIVAVNIDVTHIVIMNNTISTGLHACTSPPSPAGFQTKPPSLLSSPRHLGVSCYA